MAFQFSNLAEAYLIAPVTSAATTLQIPAELAARFAVVLPGNVQRCSLTDDSTAYELVDITSNPLTGVLTVTRGVEGSSPRTWAGGALLRQEYTAAVMTSVVLTQALNALGALVPAADQGLVFTGATTASLYSLTALGRALGGIAVPADGQALLALQPGTDVQAFSAFLSTFVSAGGLASVEITQLQNINTSVISSTNWGYLAGVSATGGALVALGSVAAIATYLGLGTASTPQFAALELGHATDTTFSRLSAGKAAIEGVEVVLISGVQTLTDKILTAPAITGGSAVDLTGLNGTPTPGTHTNGTLDLTDKNDLIFLDGAVTIPSGIFADRQTLVLVNATSGSLVITQGAGGTQRLGGSATTGNLTLAGYGFATVVFRSSIEWFVGGNVS